MTVCQRGWTVEFLEVRRAKREFAAAGQVHMGARLRLEGAGRLLRLPPERRERWLPLIREQWLLAVAEAPELTLPQLARLAPLHPAVVTDAFLDQALDVWLTVGGSVPARTLADLDDLLGATGRALDARLTDLYTGRTAPDPKPNFRALIAEARLTARVADPPMELLVALGPLDEADWWCDAGFEALGASRFADARSCFRRASELGCTEVRPFVAYLELCEVEYLEDEPELVEAALIAARELHPDPSPELLLYLGCRALEAGLPTSLDELASLDVERTELRSAWLAVGALRERRHDEAERRLRDVLDTLDPLGAATRSRTGRRFLDPDQEALLTFAEEMLLLLARRAYRTARQRLTPERLELLLPTLDPFAPTPLRHREPRDARPRDAVPPLDATV